MIEASITEFHMSMADILDNWSIASLHELVRIRQARNDEYESKLPKPENVPISENPRIAKAEDLTMDEMRDMWGRFGSTATP